MQAPIDRNARLWLAKRQQRLGAPLLVSLALVLVAAACSPSASAPAAATAPAPAATTAPAATSAPAAAAQPAAAASPAAAGAPAAAAASPAAAAPSGKPIVFGVVEDRSAGAAFYAGVGSDVLRVAVKQLNASGGIMGRPVDLRFENDQNDPNQAIALTRKLISDGADVIIFNSGSASSLQARVVTQEEKKVSVAPLNIDTRIVQAPNNDYVFIVANASNDITTVYNQAFQKAGYKKLAIFNDQSPTIDGQVKSTFRPEFEKAGMQIVTQESVPLDALDVSSQVLRIRDSKPDAVFVASLGGQVEATYYKTANQLGVKLPTFSLASIGNQPTTWDLASPEAMDGLVFAGSISTKNPKSQQLADLLKRELGDQFKGLVAYQPQMWDAVQLLKMGIESAKTTDGPALKQALESIKGYPATFGNQGFTLSYGPDKHQASDGLCGIVLTTFKGNRPGDPWPVYQPSC